MNGDSWSDAQEGSMFTFETADQKEVRRFRIAQFYGRAATVESGGSVVTGHVRAVREKDQSVPPCWTITIVPNPPKPVRVPGRPAPRFSVFEDEGSY
jgi:hypothetical protein